MIAADILLYIPSDDLTQRDYGTIHETMKKVLLQTKQLYLEWGRQGQPVKTPRKRKATQQPIARWMKASKIALGRAAEPKNEASDTGTDMSAGECRSTQTLHDKQQWDR